MRFEITYNINTSDLICINLKEKRLTSFAEAKVTQMMKNTIWNLEFVSVESSVYHCLHFLGLPLVMLDGVPVWP